MYLPFLSFRFLWLCVPAILRFSRCPACYVCLYTQYVNMHECLHADMWGNICSVSCRPICRCENVLACLQTCTVKCNNDTNDSWKSLFRLTVGFHLSLPSSSSFSFLFFFFFFLLCLTVDQTGNACLIGKISEASASCRRKMRRLKNVKRYTPLLCVSFLIVKEMEKCFG